MSGARVPIHGRNHRPGGSDPINFPASVLQWATAGQSGPTSCLSGATTNVSFDEGGISTNAVDVFTIEDDGAGSFGLMIHENGTYFPWWSIQAEDVFGHRVSTPETKIVSGGAQSGTSSALILGTILGSFYARGFANPDSGGNEWDVSWSEPFAVNDGISTVTPIVPTLTQSTGETLRAYGNILIFKLSDDISF